RGSGEMRIMTGLAERISVTDFRAEVECETRAQDYPGATTIQKAVPIYDAANVTDAIAPECRLYRGDAARVSRVFRKTSPTRRWA
ncbi:MAG: hypothetical protein WAT09_08650, partial [Paracoccaceae bacterium]